MTLEVPMLNRLSISPHSLSPRPVFVALLFCVTPAIAQEQGTALQEVPQIEGTYTQILSSDSLSIGRAELSPDGRWILFTHTPEEEVCQLWMVSTEGGEPFPVVSTPGGYYDGPVWFPMSDRIAYRSDHILSLDIDPATGRPSGPPQRVTLEESFAYFDLSPDGKWIAYTPLDENRQRVIRVVPSNGGIPHTIVEEKTSRPHWAPDGRSIYYVTSRADSDGETLKRISVVDGRRAEGAEPEVLHSSPVLIRPPPFPSAPPLPGMGFVYLAEDRAGEEPREVIVGPDGEPLGFLELARGMNSKGLSSDGRTILAGRRESASPLRVVSVAGGPIRTLRQDPSEPLAWTPEGDEILVKASLDGEERLFLADAAGGTMKEVRLPETTTTPTTPRRVGPELPDPVLSRDGRRLLYAVPGPAPDTATLRILDMETGQATAITSSHPHPWPGRFVLDTPTGTGGTYRRDEDEFFYWEKDRGALVLKAATDAGDSREVWAFDNPKETVSVSLWGNRIAFLVNQGGSATVFLGEIGNGGTKPLFTTPGSLDALAWSPDGRWLAATHWPHDGTGAKPMLIRVSEEGTVQGEPRRVGPGAASWWGHQWLLDSSGFLTAGTEGNIWFMSVDPAADPFPITEEEEGEIFNFVLSPDGTHAAYSPWIIRGSSLWLIDIGDVLTRSSR
jgi:Tol biopolymer transport system component